jgi:hypothetical protein
MLHKFHLDAQKVTPDLLDKVKVKQKYCPVVSSAAPKTHKNADNFFACVNDKLRITKKKKVKSFPKNRLALHYCYSPNFIYLSPTQQTIGPLSMVAAGLPTATLHDDPDYMFNLGKWALGVLAIVVSSEWEKHVLFEACPPSLCIVLHHGEVFAGKFSSFHN